MSINLFKKVGLSVVLAGAFAISANATCLSENYCIDTYIGLGGSYENMSGSGVNVNNLDGFISLGGSNVYYNKLQVGVDIKAGYGSNEVGGASLSSINKNNKLVQFDGMGKIGFNVATKDSPLFINVIGGADLMISNHGIGRDIGYIGAGIEGKALLSDKHKLTYSFGYGYIYTGDYRINSVVNKSNGYNQLFMASLGTQTKISENTSFYSKGFVKYYNLGSSNSAQVNGSQNINMPATKLWQGGIEVGISF